MSEIKDLTDKIVKFVNDRDWQQFHNPKDLAISLVLEASEVIEHFQWKSHAEIDKYVKSNKDNIGEELADVLYWVLLISHYLEIDLKFALENKIKKNVKKYPTEKAKGQHTKYNKL